MENASCERVEREGRRCNDGCCLISGAAHGSRETHFTNIALQLPLSTFYISHPALIYSTHMNIVRIGGKKRWRWWRSVIHWLNHCAYLGWFGLLFLFLIHSATGLHEICGFSLFSTYSHLCALWLFPLGYSNSTIGTFGFCVKSGPMNAQRIKFNLYIHKNCRIFMDFWQRIELIRIGDLKIIRGGSW